MDRNNTWTGSFLGLGRLPGLQVVSLRAATREKREVRMFTPFFPFFFGEICLGYF